MQELNLYEYAIVQVVPRVERGECMNAGLIMFCKRKRWIKMELFFKEHLFEAMNPEVDKQIVIEHLHAFKNVAEGKSKDSPISELPVDERFRWLTAWKSAVIQTSRPHAGKTNDLEEKFTELFEELVK